MHTVKSTKQFKSTWSSIHRQITPKIGQLTNDPSSINLISTQLYNLLMPSATSASSFNAPSQPHPDEIYIPLLSSLAKAILLQAETEVTASKTAAVPLAMVAKNLLGTLPHFEDVLLAKMVQRVGGWGVPTSLPARDINVDGSDSNQPFDEVSLRKAMGYRDVPAHVDENSGKQIPEQRESQADYITRVSGIMRVYFLILIGAGGVDRPRQTGRYWGYFARMLGGCVGGGLETAVAAEILYGECHLSLFDIRQIQIIYYLFPQS
jgi:nucleoporin GLE1